MVAVGAPALAATQPWQPLLGRPALQATPAGTSTTPPPSDQLAILGVLRRSQTASDRGPITTALLEELGPEQAGVRVASIRLLSSAAGAHAVLVSIERNANLAPNEPVEQNQLCLLFGHGGTCSTTTSLVAGHFVAFAGPQVLGLVPDGVATVVARYSDGQMRSAAVRENFFEISDAPIAPATTAPTKGSPPPPLVSVKPNIEWLDANGHAIGPPMHAGH